MKLEVQKCRWICRFHHKLEKTGASANRSDPRTLPKVYKRTHPTAYEQRRNALVRYPKYMHADEEKVKRGGCNHCKRAVTKETAFAFDFDHTDPTTKDRSTSQGGVAGLCNATANAMSLDKIKDRLDAEMAMCQLLCKNCHHRKTHPHLYDLGVTDPEGGD